MLFCFLIRCKVNRENDEKRRKLQRLLKLVRQHRIDDKYENHSAIGIESEHYGSDDVIIDGVSVKVDDSDNMVYYVFRLFY